MVWVVEDSVYRQNEITELIEAAKGFDAKGKAIALIFAEDDIELAATIKHYTNLDFDHIFVVGILLDEFDWAAYPNASYYAADVNKPATVSLVLRNVSREMSEAWVYWGYNAEFLVYPFYETRTIKDAITFMVEERRDSVFCQVVDLFARNLYESPTGVSLSDAAFDSENYYSETPKTDVINDDTCDRTLALYGGLRWRLEQLMPTGRRRLDRIALYKSQAGLLWGKDFRPYNAEYNTFRCKWHNNMTMCVLSFRVVKALIHNVESGSEIEWLNWDGAVYCDWTSKQLLEYGFMETGQWF